MFNSMTNLKAIPEHKRASADGLMPQIRDPHLHPAHHLARSISKSYKVEKLMKYLEPLVKTNNKVLHNTKRDNAKYESMKEDSSIVYN